MRPMSPELMALLDEERSALVPQDALTHVWARLEPPERMAPECPSDPASLLVPMQRTKGLRAIAAVCLATLGAAAALYASTPTAPSHPPAPGDRPPIATPTPTPTPTPTATATLTAIPPRPASALPTERPAPARGAGRSPSSLKDERALLDQARSALTQGDGASALARTDEHARRFATPQLAEERETIAIQALVVQGRFADARDRAARFEAVTPDSLFRPAVEAVLASIP
jgi:hypothetical protein